MFGFFVVVVVIGGVVVVFPVGTAVAVPVDAVVAAAVGAVFTGSGSTSICSSGGGATADFATGGGLTSGPGGNAPPNARSAISGGSEPPSTIFTAKPIATVDIKHVTPINAGTHRDRRTVRKDAGGGRSISTGLRVVELTSEGCSVGAGIVRSDELPISRRGLGPTRNDCGPDSAYCSLKSPIASVAR